MSRLGVYDNWERLVRAVNDREHLQQLALCDSFSSTSSTVATILRLSNVSSTSHLSFDYAAAANELDQVTQLSSPRSPRNNAGTQTNARGVAAIIFAVPLAYYRKRRLREYDLFVSNYFGDHVPVHLLDQLERFSLRELQVATDNFSNKNILGRGGFGKVYKGRLADGSLVAVKRLKEERLQGGEYQYHTEVKMKFYMSGHPNLLQLRGFCLTRKERMLVYPYMANGSVASCLRERTESQPPLDWAARKHIALGSAKGLVYLHEHCVKKIIHRDVKAANILLNEDFEAVVGDFGLTEFMDHEDAHVTTHFEPVIFDFGLAKFMDHEDTHVTTDVIRGTIGHIAPEYLSTGKVSEKTDVFAYGIMLLELITGQRAYDPARLANDDEVMLLDWVKRLLEEKKFGKLVDTDLRGNYIDEEVEQLIQVSLLCSQSSPEKRPKMSAVIQVLEGENGLIERWHEYLQEQEISSQESNYTPFDHNTDRSDCILPLEMEGVVNSMSSLGHGLLNWIILPTLNLKIYRFADLKKATKNFKSDMVLGVGGFGTVYKGWVDEKTLMPSKLGTGMMVAIKKLNAERNQRFEEWQSEVNFLGRLLHPNLVKLLGYCWKDKELLLVHEFMQKGSLENHLFRRNAAMEPLSWDIRLKVAIGAAKGLTFLHTSEKQIIYRDFKASSILLDGGYNAKLSDCRLAKVGSSGGESHVTTRVMGTYGYAAPEYIATGHLYVKSDVYGFGVVLLEIMTGLRAFDLNRPGGQIYLVDWMKPLLSSKRKLKTIMDARIEGQYSLEAAVLAAQLTLKCLENEPKNRPSMKEVGEVLEQIAAVENQR